MKKLLLGATIVLSAIFSANAQTTISFQDFEATMTVTPVGWSVGSATYHTKNPGWTFNNVFPTHNNSYFKTYTASHTYCAYFDDVDYNYTGSSWNNTSGTVDYDTLYTNIMNCSANSHVFVSFDLNFNNYTNYEIGNLAISVNGGNWTAVAPLPNQNGVTDWQDSLIFDISSYAAGKASVQLAFTWNNAGAVSNYNAPGWGLAVDNVDVFEPVAYDLSVTSQNLPSLMQVGKPYYFSGSIRNYGGAGITSMNMNYSVNGGPAQTQTISGISGFNALTSYNWSMNTTPYSPLASGNYTIKYWADMLNGSNADANNTNDTLSANFWVIDSVQVRQALFEEFTGQSCVFCMIAAPNVDSVALNNSATANIIKYHVPIPGRDFMYQASKAYVDPRSSTYYAITGAPDGYLDGAQLYPGGDYGPVCYSSPYVQADNSIGSPFKLTINQAEFDAATDSFVCSVDIKAYTAIASGLKAQIALTLDSMYYFLDASEDDPQKEFAPPIGTNAGGYSYQGAPDRYYPYLLKYEHVVQAMLPTATGTTLGAFASGQTQTVRVAWKKNHAWGQYPLGDNSALKDTTKYDSASTGHFVAFIQDNTGNATNGIPAKYVYNSVSSATFPILTGLHEIAGSGILFRMFPNPTNNITNIAFQLDKEQNISVSVYNLLGENVYSVNKGSMSAGQHIVPINGSDFQSGVYIVKFNTDKASTTQKLIIQK